MNLLELIFALLAQNVPIKRESLVQLRREAEADVQEWSVEDPGFKGLYAKWNDKWQFRLILAVLYIPATRWIQEYVNPVDSTEKEDDLLLP